MLTSKKARIIAAILLTVLIAADGAHFLSPKLSGNEFVIAGVGPLPSWHWMKKNYDLEGNFLGCSGTGDNCLVIAAGPDVGISLSSEGIAIQH